MTGIHLVRGEYGTLGWVSVFRLPIWFDSEECPKAFVQSFCICYISSCRTCNIIVKLASRVFAHIPSNLTLRLPNRLLKVFFDQTLKHGLSIPPVLIYSTGKVGSTSILKSLRKHYQGVVVAGERWFTPRHKVHRYLYDWSIVRRMPLKVISMVREPVSLNISRFFQNLEHDRIAGISYSDSLNLSTEQLAAIFLSTFKHHEKPLTWFDTQMKPTFGIDVFSKPFPQSGTCIYRNNNIELLVMRSELPDAEKAKAIASFLDLDCLEIQRKNVGEEKRYAKAYVDFKCKVRLPADYIQKMTSSKYFNHFYGEESIDSVIDRWSDS